MGSGKFADPCCTCGLMTCNRGGGIFFFLGGGGWSKLYIKVRRFYSNPPSDSVSRGAPLVLFSPENQPLRSGEVHFTEFNCVFV